MPVTETRRRLVAAVALAGGGLAVGVLGFVAPAAASQPATSAVTAQVGDLATVNAQSQFPRFGSDEVTPQEHTGPEPTETAADTPPQTPPQTPPGQEDPCNIEDGCMEPLPPPPPLPAPELPEPGPTDQPDPPNPSGPPTENPQPEGPDSSDCSDSLDCPLPGEEAEQGRAVPQDDAAQPVAELADTGAANLLFLGLLGAVMIGVGGLMAVRHYRGRHRA